MSRASEYARDINAINARKADAIAEGSRATGQLIGNTIATIGSVVPQQVQQVMKANAEKRKTAQIQGIFQKHGDDLPSAIGEVMKIDPDLGMDLGKRYQDAATSAFNYKSAQWKAKKDEIDTLGNLIGSAKDQESYAQALVTAKMMGMDVSQVPPEYSPSIVDQYNRALMTAAQRHEADKPKAPEAFTLTPGSKRFDATGKEIAAVPYELTPDQKADNERALTAEQRAAAAQAEAARHNRVMEGRPVGGGDNTLVAIVGPDGQPVLVPRAQAVGQKPAGGAGGANRKVTSGDANRIADYDTSLNDLNVLEKETKGMTGTGSAMGAALPNAVTNLTGWGRDSKSRQAVIDRVKQVIGKALEGGVLRKEDEYKYTKILPVIGDDPKVAASKLQGLRTAITQRRETLLDSLGDAGYDTSGYGGRQAAPSPPAAPAAKPAGKIGPYTFVVD